MNRIALPLLLALVLLAGGASAKVPIGPPLPPAKVESIPAGALVDLGSGRVLYHRNFDVRLVPASMTKVMTAYVAFEEMAKGRLKPEQLLTVSEATARQWSGQGTSLYLKAGDRIAIDSLLRGITTVSANDAAVALAEGHMGSIPRWTALMNASASELGMTESHFASPNGWPDNGATYASARDLVKLADALIARHPALYRRYFGQTSFSWNGVTYRNRDPTLGVVAGADGIKTGHTAEAGYNFLGSAERGGRRLVVVIAGAGSEAERASASRALLEWGFSAWSARPLFAVGQQIAHAQVQGGDERHVALVAARQVYATVNTRSPEPVTLRVTYSGPLVAPIAKGTPVAMLEVGPGRIPLYAAEAVGKAGPFDRLWNGVMGLLT